MTTQTQVRSNVYAKGLADEKVVKEFLKALGHTVTASSKEQDMFGDIDCFVNGVAVSIKAQHSGAVYNNICFELAQHLTVHQDCAQSKAVISRKDLSTKDVERLVASGSWVTSWYDKGEAELYYIYQADTLHIYQKSDIVNYVAKHGWLRIRPLTGMRRAYQGGTYRYCNSLCGYIDTNAIPHVSYKIVRVLPERVTA